MPCVCWSSQWFTLYFSRLSLPCYLLSSVVSSLLVAQQESYFSHFMVEPWRPQPTCYSCAGRLSTPLHVLSTLTTKPLSFAGAIFVDLPRSKTWIRNHHMTRCQNTQTCNPKRFHDSRQLFLIHGRNRRSVLIFHSCRSFRSRRCLACFASRQLPSKHTR